MQLNYKDSGVNRLLGDDASKVLYEAAKLTWENRKGKIREVVEVFPDFSGLRAVDVSNLPDGTFMNMNFDGIGTKIEIGERMCKHDTVAFDLFGMVADDGSMRGAEPVLLGSILDVRSLGNDKKSYIDFIKQLAVGYVNAAKEANVAVVNGEIAEVGARVSGFGEFNYNWGAAVIWFARKDRLLTGYKIKPGDILIGLREEGFRSNGISLPRKILEREYGTNWHDLDCNGKKMGEIALHPSRIYTRAIVEMTGGVEGEAKAKVHGIAHITGGGIPEKLGRMLKPSKLGAIINATFEPCELMTLCQKLGNVSDEEAYRTWNMGQGMIVATPEPENVIEISNIYGIEAKIIGIVKQRSGIIIKSKGFFGYDKNLEF